MLPSFFSYLFLRFTIGKHPAPETKVIEININSLMTSKVKFLIFFNPENHIENVQMTILLVDREVQTQTPKHSFNNASSPKLMEQLFQKFH